MALKKVKTSGTNNGHGRRFKKAEVKAAAKKARRQDDKKAASY